MYTNAIKLNFTLKRFCKNLIIFYEEKNRRFIYIYFFVCIFQQSDIKLILFCEKIFIYSKQSHAYFLFYLTYYSYPNWPRTRWPSSTCLVWASRWLVSSRQAPPPRLQSACHYSPLVSRKWAGPRRSILQTQSTPYFFKIKKNIRFRKK